MSDVAVLFDRVSKKFRRGERHDSLRDLFPALARKLRGGSAPGIQTQDSVDFWALRDLSFEVARGEALGIIGANGAGKSTTLKLLTRILKPTAGRVMVAGRIGALIEVAAGFHPDLTGRENVFLQGAVMGMRRDAVMRRFDEIVSFAGVEEFIDTPVKRYSSGMNARLGFSIAAHLDPEVLIIDEVLSVGDTAFQQKCFNRMLEFRARGITIVFVSHDLQAISLLSQRVLYLRREGPILGASETAISHYLTDSTPTVSSASKGSIGLGKGHLVDEAGREVSIVSPGQTLRLRVPCRIGTPQSALTFGLTLHRSTDNILAYEGDLTDSSLGFASHVEGDHVVEFTFCPRLTRGHYRLGIYVLHTPTHEYLAHSSPAAMFSVEERMSTAGISDIALSGHASQGPYPPQQLGKTGIAAPQP